MVGQMGVLLLLLETKDNGVTCASKEGITCGATFETTISEIRLRLGSCCSWNGCNAFQITTVAACMDKEGIIVIVAQRIGFH